MRVSVCICVPVCESMFARHRQWLGGKSHCILNNVVVTDTDVIEEDAKLLQLLPATTTATVGVELS